MQYLPVDHSVLKLHGWYVWEGRSIPSRYLPPYKNIDDPFVGSHITGNALYIHYLVFLLMFLHTRKYFVVCSLSREQPADIAFDRLLNKAKSYDTAMADYHHDKEPCQDPSAFPSKSVSLQMPFAQVKNMDTPIQLSETKQWYTHYPQPLPCIQSPLWSLLQ